MQDKTIYDVDLSCSTNSIAHGSIDEKASHPNSFPLHLSKYDYNSWKSFVQPNYNCSEAMDIRDRGIAFVTVAENKVHLAHFC
jgi:hypothetical protein